jgi:hypothetical protein
MLTLSVACLFFLVSGQKFSLEGPAGSVFFEDDSQFRLYNEQDFRFIDGNGDEALRIKQTDGCKMTADRRMVIHGNLLGSTSSSFKIQDQEQWKLVAIEDFQGRISGWSEDAVSNCGRSADLFLGGSCKFSNKIAKKTFTLPKHSYAKVQLSFHFIDRWEGESAVLKIDGKFVWTESYTACNNIYAVVCQKKGISVCGEDFPDRMGYPVSWTGKHDAEKITVEVSTTLNRDPCEASWGIDDVQIFIK